MNETIKLLKNHRSIRKFENRMVEEEKIKEIIECAQSASTSNFIQAYTIIRINDKEKRKDIAILAGEQKYVEECPVFLVFCADLNRNKIACNMNNKDMAEGYTESFILATVDATLAAQNALIAAESLGLGGVYIGGIRNNLEKINKMLKLPTNVYPVFGMCFGYPKGESNKKERLPLEVVFKTDEYSNDGDIEKLEEYDIRVSEYYRKRTNGERSDKWTSQISNLMSKPQREYIKSVLEKQGFYMK